MLVLDSGSEASETDGETPADSPGISSARKLAEEMARGIIDRWQQGLGQITRRDVSQLMLTWQAKKNIKRKRLSADGNSAVPSDTIGLTRDSVLKTWHLSKEANQYPSVINVLNIFSKVKSQTNISIGAQ